MVMHNMLFDLHQGPNISLNSYTDLSLLSHYWMVECFLFLKVGKGCCVLGYCPGHFMSECSAYQIVCSAWLCRHEFCHRMVFYHRIPMLGGNCKVLQGVCAWKILVRLKVQATQSGLWWCSWPKICGCCRLGTRTLGCCWFLTSGTVSSKFAPACNGSMLPHSLSCTCVPVQAAKGIVIRLDGWTGIRCAFVDFVIWVHLYPSHSCSKSVS